MPAPGGAGRGRLAPAVWASRHRHPSRPRRGPRRAALPQPTLSGPCAISWPGRGLAGGGGRFVDSACPAMPSHAAGRRMGRIAGRSGGGLRTTATSSSYYDSGYDVLTRPFLREEKFERRQVPRASACSRAPLAARLPPPLRGSTRDAAYAVLGRHGVMSLDSPSLADLISPQCCDSAIGGVQF